MKYIWVNPVVVKMYEAQEVDLNTYLEAEGFKILQGDLKILDEVRDQFVEAVNRKQGIVLDTRCPLAIDQIKRHCGTDTFHVPEIYPILIRTAFYLHQNYIENSNQDELHIMCPCKELSELGNKLAKKQHKKNITFYAWNEWAMQYPIPAVNKIGSTPIPMGFFDKAPIKVKGLTGEDEILSEIPKYKKIEIKDVELIEMLYCKGGCHNGNGV